MMIFNSEQMDYLETVGQFIHNGRRYSEVARWVTSICPECSEEVNEMDEDHAVDELEDGSQVVLIGCEGAFIINPNAVGIRRPNWQDWMAELEEDDAPARNFSDWT